MIRLAATSAFQFSALRGGASSAVDTAANISEHATEAEERVISYETDAYSVYNEGSYNKAPKPNYGPLARDVAGDNRGTALKGMSNPAHNAAQYDKLKTYYYQAQKYGDGGIKELPDGRFRFYEKLQTAKKEGEMAGLRHVREWNPQNGLKRDWYETIDHSGNIRQVRPKVEVTGGVKVHYVFDSNGNYIRKWSPES